MNLWQGGRVREDETKLGKTQVEEQEEELQGVSSPVLQLIHAGIGWTADAGNLLSSLPLRQLLGDEVGDEGLADIQKLDQLQHHVLARWSREQEVIFFNRMFGRLPQSPTGAGRRPSVDSRAV